MDIRLNACGHNVIFDCEARDTRSGFAHDATIIIDGMRMHTATVYYLNRTWEAWRFQSVCLSCVMDMIESRTDVIRERYRAERGISRIAGEKRKKEVADIVDCDDIIILLREIRRILKFGSIPKEVEG